MSSADPSDVGLPEPVGPWAASREGRRAKATCWRPAGGSTVLDRDNGQHPDGPVGGDGVPRPHECGASAGKVMRERQAGGIVLCGGKSTRMGTPKALLPFGPETMLQRVVRILGGVVSPIVVVAAPDQELPQLPTDLILARDEREGRGPLEGLRAGLKALPADVEAAYVTSCDVPLLEPGFVLQMLSFAQDHDVAVMEIDGFAHPLSAVYARATLPYIEDLLAHDRLRPVFLFEAVRTRRVTRGEVTGDPDLRTLRNLNTREDYERALIDAGL